MGRRPITLSAFFIVNHRVYQISYLCTIYLSLKEEAFDFLLFDF